ncbi:hypothetical protein N0V93_009845 [Gnomoniopsis smithogilvyi]|uniref:Uncharacterized protein n=1 Tax=Gnomoniopsis smithogilvyi TaxID=1191159 RepID=A0A9W8YIP6_9PEZI|nr:hypothetical protein N0V93_009845 [Gnomoniopsis smithogilvyi]
MEAATERHFFHHGDNQIVPPLERQNCHWCQLRSFSTHKTLPVTIVNTEDNATIPSNFRFISKHVLGPGVTPAEDEFRFGCDCEHDADCMYAGCECLDEVVGSDDEDAAAAHAAEETTDDKDVAEIRAWAENARRKPSWARRRGNRDGSRDITASGTRGQAAAPKPQRQRKKRFAYHSQGAKAGLLRGSELNSRLPIYECHDGCKCGKAECPNRVVERGRQVPLQIFRTPQGERGWGVKTMRELKRGQFVDLYVGEVITPVEADRRRQNSSKAQRKDVYLFGLDKFTDPNSQDPRLRGAPLEVDGEFMSGPTRFINHSCEPNLRIFARVGDHADKHIHDLALFAIRDIDRGEELTFDYVDGQGDIESNARDERLQEEMTKCLWLLLLAPLGPKLSPPRRAILLLAPQPTPLPLPSPAIVASSATSPRARRGRRRPLSQHINKPLRRHVWTSVSSPPPPGIGPAWTRRALDAERAAFFDTRVTGHVEVWQTVRAALEVLWTSQRDTEEEDDGEEGGDVALATAQTILTAAGVTLPTGNLADGVYDDLGNYYQLPAYVVADPVDFIAEEQEGMKEETKDVVVAEDGRDDEEEEARRRREEKGKNVVDRRAQISVVIRLSDGAKDLKLHVGKEEAVRSIVRTVREETGHPLTTRIRLVYFGKILRENNSLLEQGWTKGNVLSAFIYAPPS